MQCSSHDTNTRAHLSSQRLKEHAQGVCGSAHRSSVLIVWLLVNVFMVFLVLGLIFVPSLGLFSFYWFVLSNFNVTISIVSYYILFCYIFFKKWMIFPYFPLVHTFPTSLLIFQNSLCSTVFRVLLSIISESEYFIINIYPFNCLAGVEALGIFRQFWLLNL